MQALGKREYWLRIRNGRTVKDSDGVLGLRVDLCAISALSGMAIWSKDRAFDDVCCALGKILISRAAHSSASILYNPEELGSLQLAL